MKAKVIDQTTTKPDGKKKRSWKVRITAWFITSFIMLLFGSPFIGLGILIGWWIWH